MTTTADSAARNGRLRAISGAQPAALTQLRARSGGLGRRLRGATLPITLGVPLGVSLEILPTHIQLPAKIRTELLAPIEVEHDPERAGDAEYVNRIYREVQAAIDAGMTSWPRVGGFRCSGKGAQRCRP